jgi:hypothetical protein
LLVSNEKLLAFVEEEGRGRRRKVESCGGKEVKRSQSIKAEEIPRAES